MTTTAAWSSDGSGVGDFPVTTLGPGEHAFLERSREPQDTPEEEATTGLFRSRPEFFFRPQARTLRMTPWTALQAPPRPSPDWLPGAPGVVLTPRPHPTDPYSARQALPQSPSLSSEEPTCGAMQDCPPSPAPPAAGPAAGAWRQVARCLPRGWHSTCVRPAGRSEGRAVPRTPRPFPARGGSSALCRGAMRKRWASWSGSDAYGGFGGGGC